MRWSQEFCRLQQHDLNFDDISDKIEKAVLSIYEKAVDIYTSDDLKLIPKVLESLNAQWQELTKQGDLLSERFKKRVRDAVKGPGQVPRAEALPQPSRPQQHPSPAKAAPQGAAEGIGTGDDQVAAAAGIAGSCSGGGGDDGAGDGRVVAANLAKVEQIQQQQPPPHNPQPQQQQEQLQPPQLPQSPPPQQLQPAEAAALDTVAPRHPAPSSAATAAIQQPQHSLAVAAAGGKGKGKEKAAEGDVEEELEEVADSEEEGRSDNTPKHYVTRTHYFKWTGTENQKTAKRMREDGKSAKTIAEHFSSMGVTTNSHNMLVLLTKWKKEEGGEPYPRLKPGRKRAKRSAVPAEAAEAAAEKPALGVRL